MTCDGTTACVDSLTLDFPGFGASKTTCGTVTDTATYSDGATVMNVEFTANRKNEFDGFLIFTWCVEPEFEKTATETERSRRSTEQDLEPEWEDEEQEKTPKCTAPTVWKRSASEEEGEENATSSDPALLKLVRRVYKLMNHQY